LIAVFAVGTSHSSVAPVLAVGVFLARSIAVGFEESERSKGVSSSEEIFVEDGVLLWQGAGVFLVGDVSKEAVSDRRVVFHDI